MTTSSIFEALRELVNEAYSESDDAPVSGALDLSDGTSITYSASVDQPEANSDFSYSNIESIDITDSEGNVVEYDQLDPSDQDLVVSDIRSQLEYDDTQYKTESEDAEEDDEETHSVSGSVDLDGETVSYVATVIITPDTVVTDDKHITNADWTIDVITLTKEDDGDIEYSELSDDDRLIVDGDIHQRVLDELNSDQTEDESKL